VEPLFAVADAEVRQILGEGEDRVSGSHVPPRRTDPGSPERLVFKSDVD
jgi:hypothetical protein